MNRCLTLSLAIICCFAPNPLRGQEVPIPKEVLQVEEAMRRAIREVEPSIATILVSRSEVYRKHFHDQPPEDEPGKLGPFDPNTIPKGPAGVSVPSDNIAKPGEVARNYDLASQDYAPEAYGSGVVIDGKDLLVLTNYHVVRDATKIYVRFAPGKGSYADIHAADPRSDLAVLRLLDKKIGPLKEIKFGDGGAVQKGQFVVAIAAPFAAGFRDGSPGASWGIISNIRKRAMTMKGLVEEDQRALYLLRTLIQTDARLNRGCSGGALIDLKGQMIGLTTSRAVVPGNQAMGTLTAEAPGLTSPAAVGEGEAPGGLAVPIDANWKRIIDRLRQGAEVEYGFLGVSWPPAAQSTDGEGEMRIERIIGGSPAEKAGLRPGDWIRSVNGVQARDQEDLFLAISMIPAGSEARIEVRDRSPMSVPLAKFYVRGKIIASRKIPAVRGIRVDFTSVLWLQHYSGIQFPLQRREIQPGVYVTEVQPGSRAANAKLQLNDVITHVNGQKVENPTDFYREAAKVPSTTPIELTLYTSDWGRTSRSSTLVIP
jgi:serine protease Do